jgi:hypothetical protein
MRVERRSSQYVVLLLRVVWVFCGLGVVVAMPGKGQWKGHPKEGGQTKKPWDLQSPRRAQGLPFR